MRRRQWLRFCLLMVLILALLQLPRVVLAHHEDGTVHEDSGATLIFDLSGCQRK